MRQCRLVVVVVVVVFTALRYASTIYVVVMCPSVRPSVRYTPVGLLVSKRLDGSTLFSARKLPSTYPTLRFNEIRVTPKVRVLNRIELSKTEDFENFASAYLTARTNPQSRTMI